MKKTLLAALLGMATLAPFAAQAEGSYVKLGVGRSDYKVSGLDSFNGTSGTLGVGFNLDKTWDLELGYINFGKDEQSFVVGADSAKFAIKTQSVYLAAIGKVPAGESFSFFGKAGLSVNRSEADGSDTIGGVTTSTSASSTKTGYLIGAGVAYQFTKDVAATLDYTYFAKPSDGNYKLSLITLGLNYGF